MRSLTGTDTVVLVIAGLGFGGAERSALSIASGLLVDGYRVRLVTLADSATAPAYSFPPQLGLRQLGLQRSSRGLGSGICNNLVRLWHIRAAVDDLRAPTVISFVHQTNVLTVLALWGTGARVIVCEETEPSVSAGSAAWDALRRLSYRHAAHVVVRAQAALGSLSRRYAYAPWSSPMRSNSPSRLPMMFVSLRQIRMFWQSAGSSARKAAIC